MRKSLSHITIGTRASALALWQAHYVKRLIENHQRISVTIKKITTKGDQIVDLEGNFIGFAYKKNKILRIDNLKEWHEFTINGDPEQKISRYIRDE